MKWVFIAEGKAKEFASASTGIGNVDCAHWRNANGGTFVALVIKDAEKGNM